MNATTKPVVGVDTKRGRARLLYEQTIGFHWQGAYDPLQGCVPAVRSEWDMETGEVISKQLKRTQLLPWFANRVPCRAAWKPAAVHSTGRASCRSSATR
jgi:hypothetical protein